MEIELPDGTVLEAPDNADPSMVAKNYLRNQRIAKLKADNPAEYDPSSPEYQARNSPVAGDRGSLPVRIPGTDIGFDVPVPQSVSNFAAGAGKVVADAGRGLKHLVIDGYDLVRSPQAQDLIVGTPAEQYRRYIDQVKQRDAPLLNTKAGLAGNIAGNIGLSLVPGAALGVAGKATKIPSLVNAGRAIVAPTTIRGAAALGAAQGALQPVGSDESRTVNTLIGGGLGGATQAAAKAIGLISQPVKKSLSPQQSNAVRTLEQAGVPLDAAQLTGSERLSQAKRFLTDNPITSSGQVAQAEATQRGFTRAALKTIGANADAATPDVLDKALTNIEGTFDRIAKNANVTIDNKALNGLANLSQEAKQVLEAPQAAIINRQIDEVIEKAAGNGSIPGKTYQNLRTTIGSLSRVGSAGVKEYAGKLRGVIDDALERSVSGADAAALKDARVKYRNFNGILDAVTSDTGNVSAPRLYQALNKSAYGAKKALKTGRGQTDLFKLARAGKAIIPEKLPNSGTAPRVALQTLGGGAIGALGGVLTGQDPISSAAGGAAIAGGRYYAARALQRLLNSPGGTRYLSQGIQSPTARALLTAPSSQALPAAALRQLPAAGILSLYGSQ